MAGNRSRGGVALYLVACAMAACPACNADRSGRVISWELASVVDVGSLPRWRARVADEPAIPPEVVQRLSDEFDLVHVRSASEWNQLRRCAGLMEEKTANGLDFSRGSVVGLIARVGEPAGDAWPIELQELRLSGHKGFVRFRFATGLYYPVLSDAYLIAAYVRGLREPNTVEINRRVFVISGSAEAN